MFKFTVANFRAQSVTIKLAVVAAAVLFICLFNYLLDGALFIIFGWLLFLVVCVALIAIINPEAAVKFVKETIEWWNKYRETFKRSLNEFRDMWKKKAP